MCSTTMPAQSGDPISSALQFSLSSANKCNGDVDLDTKILASAKQILFSEIRYEKSKSYNQCVISDLRSKYIILNTTQTSDRNTEVTVKESVVSEVSPKKVSPSSKELISLPTPKRVLYSPDSVRLGWIGQVPVGSGFANLGNTCYLNASLQALFHVPAFVNWLLSDTNHSSKCESMNGMTHSECLICAMCKTLQSSQKCTGSTVKPIQIYSKLKLICKHLVHGHQEDAHEFLRYLIEGMERSYFSTYNGVKLDTYSKETTPISQIFGGYLRNEVTCLQCHHVSTTFQHFQDLLLDIRTASSVDDALDSYFSRERLGDGEQGYRCEQCQTKVAATKKFTLERPPKALCIALKRFGAMGGKNGKTISVKQILDASKYRHRPSPTPLHYKLASMITHLGPSTTCGHYTAVGITSSGSYYLFDDTVVRPLPLHNVLNSNPYILIYEMVANPQKSPHPPKKEIISNGFSNSNGHSSNSRDDPKAGSSSNNTSPDSRASTSSDLRNGHNGLSTQPKPFKVVYVKGKVDLQPGQALVKVINKDPQSSNNLPKTTRDPQPTQSPVKVTNVSPGKANAPQLLESPTKMKSSPVQKEAVKPAEEKSGVIPDRGSPKKADLPPTPTMMEIEESSISRPSSFKENNLNKMPLPCTPEKKADEKIFSSSEDEKNSPALRLVPYLDGSSESEGEFVPPKPTPSKEPQKSSSSTKSSGILSPAIPKVKGVRIEVEGLETASQMSCSQPGLHSPAGSTSSGKWSVTSAERERTPDKDRPLPSQPINKSETNERLPNGSGGVNGRSDRWDGSKSSSSTMDHLMKSSHRGYGGQVKTWGGGRSEIDAQVEGERNYLKRSHDSYNDDYDRGKNKKMKKYHNKDSNGNGRNRFQEYQNRKNSWQGGQKYFRDYALENRNKQQRYYFNNNRNRFWE